MPEDALVGEDLLIGKMREAGLRLTLPRRAIVHVLATSEEPFLDAQTIIDRASTNTGHMDASTVYRNLGDLARVGLVHHIPLGNGQPGTWHITLNHDHEHLVCENCGTTIEVPHTEFAPLYEVLRTQYGFQTNPHHFAFLGFCSKCEPQTDHPHPHGSENRKGPPSEQPDAATRAHNCDAPESKTRSTRGPVPPIVN